MIKLITIALDEQDKLSIIKSSNMEKDDVRNIGIALVELVLGGEINVS